MRIGLVIAMLNNKVLASTIDSIYMIRRKF